jgi:hypothetical protein
MIGINYEVSNIFTYPFDLGVRHLMLATCDGSQKDIQRLADLKMIRQIPEKTMAYGPLTKSERTYHFAIGTVELLGYLIFVIPALIGPFLASVADAVMISQAPSNSLEKDAPK